VSTIDSPRVVAEVLKHDGDMNLGEGPRMTCDAIIEYRTGFGGLAWKMIYGRYGGYGDDEPGVQVFLETGNIDYSTEPQFLMRFGQITEYGHAFLRAYGESK
jgi:hypothetical protein